jgi:2-polyprenyl-3-methyl-5-hydroxy-6-metoxy-1,4-benzoquinol methylase
MPYGTTESWLKEQQLNVVQSDLAGKGVNHVLKSDMSADGRLELQRFHELLQKEVKEGNPSLDQECMQELRAYYRGIYERDSRRLQITQMLYVNRLEPLLRLVSSETNVLDCGCNTGSESILMGLRGASVTGVDIQQLPIRIAERRLPYYEQVYGKPLQVKFYHRDLFSYLEETETAFDLVYVQEAISHIHPVPEFLQRVSARLKKGGILIVSDTNRLNAYTFYKAFRARLKYGKEAYLVDPGTGLQRTVVEENLFTTRSLKALMGSAGLEPETVHYSGFIPPFGARFLSPRTLRALEGILRTQPLIRQFGAVYTIIARK